ncbi:hypothetical protein D1007_08862 [Hordeum vulgare]|nr:hypothetical protein D1007_08862 [Hordeum vulgare]
MEPPDTTTSFSTYAICASSASASSPHTAPPLTNKGGGARKFEFNVEFLPSKAKLGDGSMRDIERDTIVKWEVDFAEIDPQDLQSMEEKTVKNMVEKIGESIFWGPEQDVALLRFDNWKGEYVRIKDGEVMVDEIDRQDGWTTKQTMFHGGLVDLKSDSKVGYVPSKLASLMVDDDWASERQIMPMCIGEVTVLPEEVDAEGGSDVADDDKEEKDGESSMPTDTNATRDRTEDVDGQLMEDVADDVDDAHDDELVNVYDNENPVIAVGKLFPNMDEFRMCFKTYAVKHEFDAKTKWTDRKNFYARCRGFDGSVKPCKWRKHAGEPLVVEHCWPKKKARGNGCRKKRSSDETIHIQPDLECLVQNEQDLDGVVQNEQDLDVLLQDEQDFDFLVPTEDMGTCEDIPVDVVQAEPILEVELPTEDIPSNVVPTEPILEVVLPTPDDIGSDDTATIVVRNKAVVPGSPVKKIKSLSELGVVQSKTSIAKKNKKLSGRRKVK